MNPDLDLNDPAQILQEIAGLDYSIRELSEQRNQMKRRLEASRGFARLVRTLNFLNSQKQITRHLRLYKIQRERLELHYERLHGEPVPAEYRADQP